jgi:hypothetical protein
MKKMMVAVVLVLTVVPAVAQDNMVDQAKDAVRHLNVMFYNDTSEFPQYYFSVAVAYREYWAEFQYIKIGPYRVEVYAMDELYRNLFRGQAELNVQVGFNQLVVSMDLEESFNFMFTVEGLPEPISLDGLTVTITDDQGNGFPCNLSQGNNGPVTVQAFMPFDFTTGIVHFWMNGREIQSVLNLDFATALSGVVTIPYQRPPDLGDVSLQLEFPGGCFDAIGDPVLLPSNIKGTINRFTIDRGYLYFETDREVWIFNLKQNPTAPAKVATIKDSFGYAAVKDGVLAVFSQAQPGGGIAIYDVKDPAQPILASFLQPPNPDHLGGGMLLSQGRLYSYKTGFLNVFDVKNPYQPIHLADLSYEFGDDYLYDLRHMVAASKKLLYLFRVDTLTVLDVSDYKQVRVVNEVGGSFHKAELAGKQLVVQGQANTELWNISDPLNPLYENTYGVVPSVTDLNVACDYLIRTSGDQLTVNRLDGQYIGSLNDPYLGESHVWSHYLYAQYSACGIRVVDLAAVPVNTTK